MFGVICTLMVITWIVAYIIARVCKSIEIDKQRKTFEKINAENRAYREKEERRMKELYGSSVPPIISKYLQDNGTSNIQEK